MLVGALGNRLLIEIYESLELPASAEDLEALPLAASHGMPDMTHPLLAALERKGFEGAVAAVGEQSNDFRKLLLGQAAS